MKQNLGIFITVRTGSTRLPNKSLIKIGEKYTIEYVIERAKKSKLADKVVLCTTLSNQDDILCEIAKNNNIDVFRGSTEDKLERWNGACKFHNVSFFITADGDDILCDSELMDLGLNQYINDNSIDFIESKDVVVGAFTYGISANALKKVCEIKNSTDTEMMWVYFTNTGLFNVKSLEGVDPYVCRSDIRMTLDYKEDLEFFTNIIENFKDKEFNIHDIVRYIDLNPEVKNINFHRHKEWAQNQKNKTKLVLK